MAEFDDSHRTGIYKLLTAAGRHKATASDWNWPDRVCSFNLSDDQTRLRVQEECDEYFSVDLTPAEVDALVAFLQEQRALMAEPRRKVVAQNRGRTQGA